MFAVKSLCLVTPWTAQRLGAGKTEAPVFISPEVTGQVRCPYCPVTYCPVIYQAGYVTEAHHFHEADGGIYYFASEKMVRCPSGWLADLQPLGRQVEDRGIGHAAAVRVLSIQAYCPSDSEECRWCTEPAA